MNLIDGFLPVVLILGIGRMLRSFVFTDKSLWSALETTTYFVFFPSLIVKIFAQTDFSALPWKVFLVLVASQCMLFIIGWFGSPSGIRGVVTQSNVRVNAFIALSVSAGVLGETGLALAAIMLTLLIPTSNILSVCALTASADRPIDWTGVVLSILKNPLVIAALLGAMIAMSSVELPQALMQSLDFLGRPVLALGLLTVGAAFDPNALGRAGFQAVFWSLLRLILLPVIAVALAQLINLDPTSIAIVFLSCAVPTAAGGYLLAKKLGADAELAANLIGLQTVIGIATLPALYLLIF